MTRFLHVANGFSTTRLISAAGIPGQLSIWADPLYEGPVPGDCDDAGLVTVRARYLSNSTDDSYAGNVQGLQEWRDIIARGHAYDELVLWFEHDLFDQLNLLQLLDWIAAQPSVPRPVSLIEIGSFAGRPTFKGLGELTARELAPLFDTRIPIGEDRFSLASRAWFAFRQPTPQMLDDLCRSDTSAMPFLSAALNRFLEEYPWTTDGLSRTERRVLQVAASGPLDLWSAFTRMHENERAYYVTDLTFLGLLRRWSMCTPPLVTIKGDSLDADRIPKRSLSITERGRALLARDIDGIAEYGIDRWLGGVHLTTNGAIWRWNPESKRILNSEF